MNNIMVDLETLGTGSNAVIIAIGAVEFDPTTGALGREFYTSVDADSCVKSGMTISASTVMWWMKQSDAARAAVSNGGVPVSAALLLFANWVRSGGGPPVIWGNGATFDNVILSNAFLSNEEARPWSYSGDRCYRTLKSLFPEIKQEAVGTAHYALDDAKYQALHAIKLLQRVAQAQ